jgi:hypothetical protein
LTDNNVLATTSDYQVSLDWGDGTRSTLGQGVTLQARGGGLFNVVAEHLYGAIAGYPAVLTVVRLANGQPASASASIAVRGFAFTGGLDPSSDTGPSNRDGVTAINQPTFQGTAPPLSIVQLSLRRPGEGNALVSGRAITRADGVWSMTLGPVVNGVYQVVGTVSPASGSSVTEHVLAPLVVDAGTSPWGRPIRARGATETPNRLPGSPPVPVAAAFPRRSGRFLVGGRALRRL